MADDAIETSFDADFAGVDATEDRYQHVATCTYVRGDRRIRKEARFDSRERTVETKHVYSLAGKPFYRTEWAVAGHLDDGTVVPLGMGPGPTPDPPELTVLEFTESHFLEMAYPEEELEYMFETKLEQADTPE